MHLDAATLGPPLDGLRVPTARELRACRVVEEVCASYRTMIGYSDMNNEAPATNLATPTIAMCGGKPEDQGDVDPTSERETSVLRRLAIADVAVAEEFQSVELAFARALHRSIEGRSLVTLPFDSLRELATHATRVRRRLVFTLRSMREIERT